MKSVEQKVDELTQIPKDKNGINIHQGSQKRRKKLYRMLLAGVTKRIGITKKKKS